MLRFKRKDRQQHMVPSEHAQVPRHWTRVEKEHLAVGMCFQNRVAKLDLNKLA